jgi:hypothetical protein
MSALITRTPQKTSFSEAAQMNVYDLGFSKDYQKIWDFQKAKLSQRIEGKTSDSLILVEHDHVITLGRSSHPENVLTNDLPIFEIERGGDATYHGPGQLVIYPIISYDCRFWNQRRQRAAWQGDRGLGWQAKNCKHWSRCIALGQLPRRGSERQY